MARFPAFRDCRCDTLAPRYCLEYTTGKYASIYYYFDCLCPRSPSPIAYADVPGDLETMTEATSGWTYITLRNEGRSNVWRECFGVPLWKTSGILGDNFLGAGTFSWDVTVGNPTDLTTGKVLKAVMTITSEAKDGVEITIGDTDDNVFARYKNKTRFGQNGATSFRLTYFDPTCEQRFKQYVCLRPAFGPTMPVCGSDEKWLSWDWNLTINSVDSGEPYYELIQALNGLSGTAWGYDTRLVYAEVDDTRKTSNWWLVRANYSLVDVSGSPTLFVVTAYNLNQIGSSFTPGYTYFYNQGLFGYVIIAGVDNDGVVCPTLGSPYTGTHDAVWPTFPSNGDAGAEFNYTLEATAYSVSTNETRLECDNPNGPGNPDGNNPQTQCNGESLHMIVRTLCPDGKYVYSWTEISNTCATVDCCIAVPPEQLPTNSLSDAEAAAWILSDGTSLLDAYGVNIYTGSCECANPYVAPNCPTCETCDDVTGTKSVTVGSTTFTMTKGASPCGGDPCCWSSGSVGASAQLAFNTEVGTWEMIVTIEDPENPGTYLTASYTGGSSPCDYPINTTFSSGDAGYDWPTTLAVV